MHIRLRARLLASLVLAALTGFAVPAAGQATDTDGDTMPDAWETFFGLDPGNAADAAGDPDGDGLTNAQEYAAGRHPVGRFARYFAEGATGYFDTSLAVLNLSTTDTAHVSIALLDESGGVTPHRITLAPRARQSVSLNAVLGTSAAVSIIVESDVAIAADRAMTWGPGGVGLSLDSGAPAPATTWYFAEGATGPFLLYYLFENPGAAPATVTVRYLREGDTPISRTRTLPPHSRTTVFVNADDPGVANASLGAIVTADQPILAERAMYMQANGTFAGGSASSGSPALSTQWYFGEGATGPFFHAFLSLLNPGSTPATATVTYHMSDGSTASKAYAVPAEGRRTVYFNGEASSDATLAALANGPVWFTVSATQPIVGERAMWWSDWPWYEGHAAAGSTSSDVAWGVAEGRHGGPDSDQAYVLVGNTTGTAGQVRVSLIPDTGATQTRDLTIAAGARLTINVGTLFGLTGASRFSVTVESIGASPVPLAVDYARYRSVNGVPFSGGGAAPAVPLLPADAAPSVTATTPADGATGASSTNDLVVTFNEPVNAAAGAFTLACPTATPIALTVVTASPAAQFTLDPAVPLPASTTCTLTVLASAITDADSTDPPDVMTANAVVTFTTAAESAPAVSTTAPANGAVQVGLGSSLTITFTEPVDVAGNWFQIVCATSGTRTVGDTAVGGGPTTFTIDPTVDFAAGELCTVTVVAAQVSDQDPIDPPNTMAADHVFAFTADVAPTVLSTTPANGAVNIGTATPIAVTFSEPVTLGPSWFQIVCATSGTRNVTDTIVTGGPTAFTIDPNADFAAGELCTVTIAAAQVSDQDAGDPPDTLAANYVFAFTTDVAPTVTATTPVNGATNATTTGNLTVTFSEPVSVAGNWFQVVCGSSGTRVPADTVVSGGPTVYTIDPNADFAPGETCTVTLAAASIADQDAGDPPDALAADDVFAFTIDAQPTVTATSPVNASTTTTNTDVTVTFSEPVVLTGTWFQIVCATSGTRDTSNAAVTGGPTVYTINPNVDFTGGELCTATIFAAQVGDSDAADPPDSLAANYIFSFTPDAAPAVASTTPLNAATVASSTDLSVTFSEAVTATGSSFTLTCTVSGAHTFALSGGPTAWTLNPDTDFTAGETCTWTTLAAGVSDQDATDPPDTMAANHVVSFTVDARPSVTATTPANGATQVATTASLSVTFSEPVDVTGSWFSISCSVSGAHTAVVSGGPTTFGLDPGTDFQSGDVCTVTVVAGQVADQDAIDPPDTMAANFVFSFTVDTAPGVTTTTPVNGATGVLPSTTITVNFSESVNATAGSFSVVCNGAPQTFTLSASPAAAFTLTPTTALPEGVFCTVTVTAAQITDADAGDPPDTMLADVVFTFAIPPNANNDARGATGNVSINTATTGFSTLSNDAGPGIAVTAFDATSVQGGAVSVNSAGVFTYTPPVGYEGVDSFTYTITNAAGSDTAAVNLTVSGMLWFIDNTASACTTIAGGCGRQAAPFSSLAAFDAVNGGVTMGGGDIIDPEAGDAIFIATGAGSYVGPLTLEANQRVIGQGATSTVATLAGITVAPDSVALPSTLGAAPTITSGGTGITLAQNNRVHGLSITNTGGTGLSGNGFGTLTVSENVRLSNTTTAGTPVSLSNGTLAASFVSISAGNNDGNPDPVNGIVLTNTTGSFAVTGSSGGLCGGQVTVNSVGTAATITAPVTGDCTGGVIQRTTGAGIVLDNVAGISLTRMRIAESGTDGIRIQSVNGFALISSSITDSSGATTDKGIDIGDFSTGTPVSGTIAIVNSTIAPSPHDNVSAGISSGTSTWSISGSVFSGGGNTGVNIEVRNAATMVFDMNGSAATGIFSEGVHIQPGGGASAVIDATVRNSSFTNNTLAIDVNHDGLSAVTYRLLNNTVLNQNSHAFNVFTSATPGTGGTMNATLTGNVIGNAGSVNSGSAIGNGIRVNVNGGADANVLLANNTIRQTPNGRGIEIIGRNGTGGLDVTVSNNDVNPQDTSGFPLAAILVQSNCVTVCNTVRADVQGNLVPVGATTDLLPTYIALVESNASTLQLVDSSPANANCTDQAVSTNTGSASASAGCTLIAGPISTPP